MKKKIKKVPTTLFGMEIEYSPDAHKFSVAMAMVGLTTDIKSADLIIRLYDKVYTNSCDFSISDAINLRNEVMHDYDVIKEKFEELTNKKK
jgi:hypothetical protein